MTRLKIVALAAVAVLMSARTVDAATATGSLSITASVANSCAVSALALTFGQYDAAGTSLLNGSTTITVLCTVGTAYNVGLNAGTGTGATVTTRKLTASANTLNYTLYQDTGRTTIWGNTIGTNTVAGVYAIGQQPHGVYGQIPAGQIVPAGTYNDTITVTITY